MIRKAQTALGGVEKLKVAKELPHKPKKQKNGDESVSANIMEKVNKKYNRLEVGDGLGSFYALLAKYKDKSKQMTKSYRSAKNRIDCNTLFPSKQGSYSTDWLRNSLFFAKFIRSSVFVNMFCPSKSTKMANFIALQYVYDKLSQLEYSPVSVVKINDFSLRKIMLVHLDSLVNKFVEPPKEEGLLAATKVGLREVIEVYLEKTKMSRDDLAVMKDAYSVFAKNGESSVSLTYK